MIFEFLVLFLIIYFSFVGELTNVLFFFILVISFNSILISCFSNYFDSTGLVFSFWKESLILILFCRTRRITAKVSLYPLFFLILILILIYTFFALTNNYSFSRLLPSIRTFIFPLLLFYSVRKMKFDSNNTINLIYIFCFLCFITNFFGVIEHFFFHNQLLLFKGSLLYGDNGEIVNKTTSLSIMGLDRMCGITDGGPNMFGILNALMIVVFLVSLYSTLKVNRLLVVIALLCATFGLFFSYSRAGMGFVLFTCLSYFLRDRKLGLFFFVAFIFLLLYIIIGIYFPDIDLVLKSTLDGKEASAADRGNNFFKGINFVISNPMGIGVGGSNNSYENCIFFESGLLNIAVELGVIGLFLISIFHIKAAGSYRKNDIFSTLANIIPKASLLTACVSISPFSIPFYYIWMIIVGVNKLHDRK